MSLFAAGQVLATDTLNQKTMFIGASPPASPTDGQLWYNTTLKLLKVYDAGKTLWKALFQEIGRTTLASAASSISVQSLPAVKNLFILVKLTGTSPAVVIQMRLNNDSGTNYFDRQTYRWVDGGTVGISQTSLTLTHLTVEATGEHLTQIFVLNWANQKKVLLAETVIAGTAADSSQMTGCWNNMVDQITRVDVLVGSGTFNSGSEVVVFGCD